MKLKRANRRDLGNLVRMNVELREDEKAPGSMSEIKLRARMARWLDAKSYDVLLLVREGRILGYALVDHTKKPAYVRHLFIERDSRRRGHGTEALNLLLERYSGGLELDVNSWNAAAIRFYEKFGFRKTFIAMKYERPSRPSPRIEE
jgi:ribosomal protein S18 acetylase RimI-like enzyme